MKKITLSFLTLLTCFTAWAQCPTIQAILTDPAHTTALNPNCELSTFDIQFRFLNPGGCDLNNLTASAEFSFDALPTGLTAINSSSIMTYPGDFIDFTFEVPDLPPNSCENDTIEFFINNITIVDPCCPSGNTTIEVYSNPPPIALFLVFTSTNFANGASILTYPDIDIYPDPVNFVIQTTPNGCGQPPTITDPCNVITAQDWQTAPIPDCSNGGVGIAGVYEWTATEPFADIGACDYIDQSGTLNVPACALPTPLAVTADPNGCPLSNVDVCIDFDIPVDPAISLTVDGTTQTGTSPSTQICVNLALPANNTCAPIPHAYTISADCGGTAIDLTPVALPTTTIYPQAQPPTLQVVVGNPQCNYTIQPACPGDVLNPNTVVNENCGAAGLADVNIQVTTADGCTDAFDVPKPDCPACGALACPTSDFGGGAPQFICDSTAPTLLVEGTDFNISDPDASQLGAIQWFIGNDPQNDPAYAAGTVINHTGADPCADEVVTLFAFIQCDLDLNGIFDITTGDSWVQVASLVVNVYPPAQAPTIQVIAGDPQCNYTIQPACPGDVFNPNTVVNENCGSTGLADLNIQVTTADGCTDFFDVPKPDCPACGTTCGTANAGGFCTGN